MRNIIAFFVDRSFMVNTISAFICIAGIISFSNMRRDLIPAFQFNYITIAASIPGASAIDMEKQVTFPIEEALSNISDLNEISSSSSNGSSSITLEFSASHKNIQETLELVRARINKLKRKLPDSLLPINVQRSKVDSVPFTVLNINGVDENKDTDRDWVKAFKESLLKVPGIVKIDSSLTKREIIIQFNLEKLSRYELAIPTVRNKIIDYFNYAPIGNIDKDESSISIELIKNINSLQDIRKLPITGNDAGILVRLQEVASVNYKFADRKMLYLNNGKSTVQLTLNKDLDSDAIALRDKAKVVIEKYKEKFPNHINARITDDGPHFIEKQLEVLKRNGLTGLFLVFICLYFLLGFRVSLMTAWGIPLAYLGSFIVLNSLNLSIDLISVIGMILVIGILVDDAIIVTENYVHNLEKGLVAREAAIEAARTTIIPVTGTILTTVVAFSPLILVKSMLSEIFISIPIVIMSALALSWFESFFVLPNHLAHFVKTKSKRSDSSFLQILKQKYRFCLKYCLKLRYLFLVLLVASLGASFYLAANKMSKSYHLQIGAGDLEIDIELMKSKSLEESQKILEPIHNYLRQLKHEEIDFIETKIGETFNFRERKKSFRYATIKVKLNKDLASPKRFEKKLKKEIEKDIEQFKTKAIKNILVESKIKKNNDEKEDVITIFVSGGDKLSFEKLQNQIKNSLEKTEHVLSIGINEDRFQDSWQFVVNKDELIRYNLNSRELVSQLSDFFSQQELSDIRLNGETISVYTKYKNTENINYNDVKDLKIITDKGITVPIKFLGNWKKVRILKTIKHSNLERKFEIDLKYNKDKIKKKEIVTNISKNIEPLQKQYPSYTFSVQSESKQEKRNKKWLLNATLLCLFLILLILALCLNSIIQPLIVMIPIPFGIIGIILSLYIHGMELGIMSVIGLIGMAGVVVNDSLIMIVAINDKMKTMASKAEAIIEGACMRLRAILLTTITTLGGVFPMAYGLGGESGFTQPLAFVMGWGLLFATILTLFVLPSLLAVKEDFESLSKKAFLKLKPNKK